MHIDIRQTKILNYANIASDTNTIELTIYINELINPYLEFIKVDGTIVNTEILPITYNYINYEMPFEYYSLSGAATMRVRAEGYDSDYIEFTITKDIAETDNVVVKIENDDYLVRTMNQYKYYDLPIASKNSLGTVIVGDGLEINNKGVLSSTGGGSEHGIPEGGTTGQVLAKTSNANYEVDWVDQTGGSGSIEIVRW